MYKLQLNKFKNIRIILTHKYMIIINKNGIIKFNTNFFNIFINNNNLYLNLLKYNNIYNNIYLFYINKYYLYNNSKDINKKLLNYYNIYLTTLYYGIYYLIYNYNLTIILKGVGYKFIIENNILKIRVGYSHYIHYNIDPDIYMVVKNPTTLCLYSNNKVILTKIAARLKLYKKTNYYKGTGIFYSDEFITLKKKNNSKNAQ